MGMLEPTSAEKFEKRIDFQAKITKFLLIFLYKYPKMRENVPTSSRHISATVWSWGKSEPILETR